MGWRNRDRDVLCYFCRFVEQRWTDGGTGRSRGRQGEGAVFDGPAVSSGSVSPSSPVLCCPLGISEHESAGPFLNVQKKVQVCGEGSSL